MESKNSASANIRPRSKSTDLRVLMNELNQRLMGSKRRSSKRSSGNISESDKAAIGGNNPASLECDKENATPNTICASANKSIENISCDVENSARLNNSARAANKSPNVDGVRKSQSYMSPPAAVIKPSEHGSSIGKTAVEGINKLVDSASVLMIPRLLCLPRDFNPQVVQQLHHRTNIGSPTSKKPVYRCLCCPYHAKNYGELHEHVRSWGHMYGINRLKTEKQHFYERVAYDHTDGDAEGPDNVRFGNVTDFNGLYEVYDVMEAHERCEYEELLYLSLHQMLYST
jgi:hypothetical protein